MFNPFLNQCAGIDLDESSPDAPGINAQAFEDCLRLIEDVRHGHRSQALLLTGEAGSGKTHLLGRLQRSLDVRAGQGELSVFVPIRMVTSARMLWRLIREHLAKAVLRSIRDKRRLRLEVLRESAGEMPEISRDLRIVLGCLLRGERSMDAGAWLKGQELPSAALEALGLAATAEDEQQDATSRRVVMEICNAIAPVPVVFCFDQIESIQGYSGDKDSFRYFGAEISDLHDSTRNVAILTCLQIGLINDFTDGIGGGRGDSYIEDRLSRRRSALYPLTPEQSIELIRARLDADEDLRRERARHAERLWPIDENMLRDTFPSQGRLVARKVIARCSELFDQWRGNATKVESPEEFLERSFQDRLRPVPADESEMILRTGLFTLFQLRGLGAERFTARRGSPIEGVVGTSGKQAAVAVCNQRPQGGGLANRLKSVEANWPADASGLVIFRDSRRGIGPGATAAREALRKLEHRGARLVMVEQETLAALQALNELLADAKSGDLALRGDTVSESTVESWLATRLPPDLEALLDGFTDQAGPGWLPALAELVNEARVMRLEDAARQIDIRPEEVEEFVRLHPSLFGFAGGSARILYRTVHSPSEENAGA